jgi:hypothetical protein
MHNSTIQNIINITKFWLDKTNNQSITTKQILELIRVMLHQNYFQYDCEADTRHSHGITLVKHPS